MQELNVKEVPCLIRTGDPYRLAIECNADEETYAPMDLFDWLGLVGKLRNEGLTQAAIGERIGWSRDSVKNYAHVLDRVGTQISDLAKQHQAGRVPANGTGVPAFDFTEGGFGILDCMTYPSATK